MKQRSIVHKIVVGITMLYFGQAENRHFGLETKVKLKMNITGLLCTTYNFIVDAIYLK